MKNAVLGNLIASIVVLIATVLNSVAMGPLIVSILSIAFIVTVLVLKRSKPHINDKKLFNLPQKFVSNRSVHVELMIAFSLFVMWAVGAGIFTFQGPFIITSNGYFGCWGALVCSAMHMRAAWAATAPPNEKKGKSTMDTFKGAAKDLKAQLGAVIVCYAVVLAAGLQPGGGTIVGAIASLLRGQQYTWEQILAITISSIEIVAAISLLIAMWKRKASDNAIKYTVFLMCLCAFVEAFICTFRFPFVSTGNGFFGSWAGLICVSVMTLPVLPDKIKKLMFPAEAKVAPAADVHATGEKAAEGATDTTDSMKQKSPDAKEAWGAS